MTDVLELARLGGVPVQSVAEQPSFIKMLLYGVPGAGKTFLAGSAAEVESMRPVLFVDVEGGTRTVRRRWPDIHVVRVKDTYNDKGRLVKSAWEQLQDVYTDLKVKCEYRTLVIDSLSEAHKLSMYSVMQRALESSTRGDVDPDVPAQRDWGKGGEQIRRMVRMFRDLDAHVIFTAHEQEKQDQRTGAIRITPALPGKLAQEIPGFLDVVLYLYAKVEKDQVVRRALSRLTDKHIAKDRDDVLPMTLENPSMASIAELLLG